MKTALIITGIILVLFIYFLIDRAKAKTGPKITYYPDYKIRDRETTTKTPPTKVSHQARIKRYKDPARKYTKTPTIQP